MISIKVDPISVNRIYAEIENKIDGVKELTTSQTKQQLMDVAFSKTALKFVKTTNMVARADKAAFHHVYEWGGTGNETSRLFRIIKKGEAGGSASIYYKFNNSNKKAPISPALSNPGPTGKYVTTSGIFKRKAEVMEAGSPVSFITSKTIAIAPGGSVIFIPPGKTINIKSPGGTAVAGSFQKHYRAWWAANFPSALDDSGISKKLEINMARALNKTGAGRTAARNAIKSTLGRYKIIGSVV
jgi:hypothetical protein